MRSMFMLGLFFMNIALAVGNAVAAAVAENKSAAFYLTQLLLVFSSCLAAGYIFDVWFKSWSAEKFAVEQAIKLQLFAGPPATPPAPRSSDIH